MELTKLMGGELTYELLEEPSLGQRLVMIAGAAVAFMFAVWIFAPGVFGFFSSGMATRQRVSTDAQQITSASVTAPATNIRVINLEKRVAAAGTTDGPQVGIAASPDTQPSAVVDVVQTASVERSAQVVTSNAGDAVAQSPVQATTLLPMDASAQQTSTQRLASTQPLAPDVKAWTALPTSLQTASFEATTGTAIKPPPLPRRRPQLTALGTPRIPLPHARPATLASEADAVPDVVPDRFGIVQGAQFSR
jgi:hypothetical protein